MTHEDDHLPTDPAAHWEARYADRERIWSGAPNTTLVRVVDRDLPAPAPGDTALDLGCGEGADVLWLAGRGWRALGVDISPTAVRRAEAAAAAEGLSGADATTDGAADFAVLDLAHDPLPAGPFELVTASFLHSHVDLPREEILRNAAAVVAPGGRLLVLSHAAPPPWSQHSHEDMTGPEEDWAQLGLVDSAWELERCETVERRATGPDGEQATLLDGVILARRH